MNWFSAENITAYWPIFAFIMSILVGGGSAMIGSKLSSILFQTTTQIEVKELSQRVANLESGAAARDKVLLEIQKQLAVIVYQNELLLKGKELK